MSTQQEITSMPTLALRGLTIFPNMMLHFDVGRDISIKALDDAMANNRPLFLVTQRDLTVESPKLEDLYTVGTISKVRQILRLPSNTVRVMVEGERRGRLLGLPQATPFMVGEVEPLPNLEQKITNSIRTEALIRRTYDLFERYVEVSPRTNPDILSNMLASDDPGYIADYAAQNIAMRSEDKQAILEELKPTQRLTKLFRILKKEVEVLEYEQDIQSKVHDQLTQNQRDYFLREQLKIIKTELGEGETDNEFFQYRQTIHKAKLPKEVEEKLLKEVKHLEKQPFGSSESALIRNYLEVCLELPWNKYTKERVSVDLVSKALNEDHFGLEKVKERILEFVAVKQLAPQLKGQVICLVGPPGVGKTSIAMSVARAMNRKLARLSLGGVHDEAEIRGHRKTYVGAMPGRVISAIRQAGSNNPLLLLDEIDKLGSDFRGDPASALLEVLDGEQNGTFRDHFVELPYDLSQVMFITTANTTSTIPRPLLDRMEIIELGSYTDEEKLQIAKRHLLPKELKRHGIKRTQLKITDDALRDMIFSYTKESGVRTLERTIATLCRKTAISFVSNDVKRISVTQKNLEEFLGVRKYHSEKLDRKGQVGLVNGLAWTSVGGALLEVEVNMMPGTGKLELTGNLGNVMKESARIVLSYVRSRTKELDIDFDFYKNQDIHIHFPEGAVPKDGPSAGVAITTAMVSALTNAPVLGNVAMTGEVSLRGRVLPIGGLKEKSMAALRNGMTTVIIPKDNEKDLEEIDQTVRQALRFIPVERVEEVLAAALTVPDCPVATATVDMPPEVPQVRDNVAIQQ